MLVQHPVSARPPVVPVPDHRRLGAGCAGPPLRRPRITWTGAWACFVVTLLLGALAPTAIAQEPPLELSLPGALDVARQNNPGFLSARNDLDVADWEVRSARASLLPFASASSGLSWQGAGEQRFGSITAAQLGFENQPSYYFSSYNLGLSYQLDGATLLAPGRARASRSRIEADVRSAAVDLDRQVTHAYLEVLRQQDQVDLARAQIDRTRFNLRLAEGQRDVGQATAIDVQQAEVQVGRSEVVLLQAEQALATARLRLLQLLDLSLDRDVALTTTFELETEDWEFDELYDMAAEENPVLQARRRARRATEYDVRVARSRYLPSLSIQAGVSGFTQSASSSGFLVRQAQAQVADQIGQCQFQNELFSRLADPLPTQDCSRLAFTDEQRRAIIARNEAFPFDFTRQPPSASLTLSLPVFQGLDRQRQVEAARAAREDAEHLIREQEVALETDLTIGLGQVRTAYRSAQIEQRNQELADEQLRVARERYRVGAIPFLDLVDAETVKAEADQALLEAVYAYHDAITDLEALVGTPLRTEVAPQPDPDGSEGPR